MKNVNLSGFGVQCHRGDVVKIHPHTQSSEHEFWERIKLLNKRSFISQPLPKDTSIIIVSGVEYYPRMDEREAVRVGQTLREKGYFGWMTFCGDLVLKKTRRHPSFEGMLRLLNLHAIL